MTAMLIDADNWIITDEGLNCETLNVEEHDNNRIILYPNPVQNKLFIKGLNENAIIKITDLTGKVIITTESQSIVNGLDVSKLNSAMYFVTISTKDSISVIKIIKK